MNTLNTAAESPPLTEPVPVHPMSDYEKFLFDLKRLPRHPQRSHRRRNRNRTRPYRNVYESP